MRKRVVNLTFHGIGDPPPHVEAAENEVWVSVDFFHQTLDRVRGREDVRITFDDGNASDCLYGLPGLLERGMTADFFICAGRIDKPGYLSTAQILELRDAGMRIGSHGFHHQPWRRLSSDALDEEIQTAKLRIEAVVGCEIDTAACPFGGYDTTVLARLKRANFRTVFTSDRGTSRPGEWLQSRNTLRRSSTLVHIDRILSDRDSVFSDLKRRTKTFLKRWR